MGLIFLWAFFDKLFGLGFTTCRNAETHAIEFLCNNAWLSGGSPTSGFLNFAVKGPFASFYHELAGLAIIDWLFMLGLLFIGLTLTFGVLVRIGSLTGALLLLLMWSALLPPANNPVLDDHIIYIIIMFGFALIHTCKHLGLGRWWSRLELVKNYKILE